MSELTEADIYDIIGEDGFQRLVAAFYKQVPDDDILGPMYPADDLEGAEERLREFLVFRFGGPQRYLEKRGHPRLRMRHNPFIINQAARDRWVQLMSSAFEEANLSPSDQQVMQRFLEHTASFLMNR
ncbi:MAG: globin [Planctomycetaceae bacterium]